MAWGVPKIGAVATVASGNITLAEPSGIASGDLMVACIAYRNGAAFTVPGDWNLVATQQSLGDTDATFGIASGVMMWCIRGGSAPTLTFNRTAGDVAQGRIIAYTGASATPYDTGAAATNPASGAAVGSGAITTAEAGELIVAMVSCGDNLTTSAFASGTDTQSNGTNTTTAPTDDTWLERADTGTNTGADSGLAIADNVWSAAATKTPSATVSGAARHVMIVGAFKMGAVTINLAGTSAGTSTAAATLGVTKNLAGSSAGTSTADADLSIATLIDLAGTSAGTSTAAATALITKNLAASSAGIATATADLLNTAEAVTLSQAAFRFYADGTETGSTALAAQDANHSIDVSAGNVNFQLRVRLQSIAGISLAGASAGTSTATATMTNTSSTINLAGSSAGTSTAAADLTVAGTGNVAFDAATGGAWQTTASSLSFSHTCTGTDLILLVGVGFRGLDNSPAVSGITYAGVSLTKIANTNDDSTTSTALRGELWYLIAPATGANNVVVTLTTGTGVVAWVPGALSLTGVHQSSPIGASTMTSEEVGAGTTLSTNLNTSFNNSMVVDYVMHRNDISIAAGANQTSRLQTNNGTNVQAMSTEATTTAGTITMSWTGLADNARRHLVVEVKAS